jgi:hypothetical protein
MKETKTMTETTNEFKLKDEILTLSISEDWRLAKLEWRLTDIYESTEPDTCLCGHNPIREICVIKNIYNCNVATVGNVCIKKFLGLPSNQIFAGLKRLKADIYNGPNQALIEHACDQQWINEYEGVFCLSNLRKTSLSSKQLNVRMHINQKLLARLQKAQTI